MTPDEKNNHLRQTSGSAKIFCGFLATSARTNLTSSYLRLAASTEAQKTRLESMIILSGLCFDFQMFVGRLASCQVLYD